MAALIVQRPSPESETRPAYFERFWSSTSAAAVKFNSHEAITLPRRQTSVTSRTLSSYWQFSSWRKGVVSASTSPRLLPTFASRRTPRHHAVVSHGIDSTAVYYSYSGHPPILMRRPGRRWSPLILQAESGRASLPWACSRRFDKTKPRFASRQRTASCFIPMVYRKR